MKLFKNKTAGVDSGRADVKNKNLKQLIFALLLIVIINLLGSVFYTRIDLTSEKRYTLTGGTREMLRNLDDIIYFRVYLEGNLPPEFQRLRNQTREMLDEFEAYSGNIQYEFISPAEADDDSQIGETRRMLVRRGLQPTQVQVRTGDATSQQLIFPGALVSYRGQEYAVSLLQDNVGVSTEVLINNSVQALEYNLANAIRSLTIDPKPSVGFVQGQGELSFPEIGDVFSSLADFYQVDTITLDNNYSDLSRFETLIIAKPTAEYSEQDKFLIDQFIMNGGSVLWFVDQVTASMDSLQPPAFETVAINRDLNLDDMLFTYGVRLNPVLLMDMQAAPIPVTTGMVGNRPRISLIPWPFFPLVNPASDHPVVKNLNMIRSEFVSSIDTVEVPDIEKTMLLSTSSYTRIAPVPVHISLSMLQDAPDENLYREPPQPVAVLLEGSFRSVFANRTSQGIVLPENVSRLDQGYPARMIVVADGDIIKSQRGTDGQVLPLGYDRFTNQTFGNKDFVLNAVNYLTDDTRIMEARAREVRLRLLDSGLVNRNRTTIGLLNTLVPVLLVVLSGILRILWRRRKYSA